jgi:hypothetical protein
MKFKQLILSGAVLAALYFAQLTTRAVVIQQGADAQYVAWEAEDIYSITNQTPTAWIVKDDAPASGGKALYQQGPDQQTGYPVSFALYHLRFKTPGTYNLYVRWRADKARSDQDANGANSYRVPTGFGDLPTDTTSLNYGSSSANNTRVPPDANNYASIKEAQTFEVTQEMIDAGDLILKIGVREWGMFIDRFVLSLDNALTDTAFNGLGNSPTSRITQGAADEFLAWEAENVSAIRNGTPTAWVVKTDAPASEGAALYQQGPDQQTGYPVSFALYQLKFKKPGTYNLYVRWRADKARSDQDANGANSYRVPIGFGDLETDTSSLNYGSSSANNTRVPPDANNYASIKEAQTYEVTQEMIDAGGEAILKIGVREWGMFIDRFVLSLNAALTDSEFNALPNTGASARPSIKSASASQSFASVRVNFDRAVKAESLDPAKFVLNNGGTVSGVALDTLDPTTVVVTTGAQTANTRYTLTISGVTDVAGNAILANSTVSFTSWRLEPGWVQRELYFGAGTTVADLLANPKYPNNPDADEFVRSVSTFNEPFADNYGGRFTTFFVPPANGAYEFYIVGDDNASLFFSTDATEANLAQVLDSAPNGTAFDPTIVYTTDNLTAGNRYLLQLLFQEGTGDSRAAVAVRAVGSTDDVATLPALSGSLIATYVNPDAGTIKFTQQPANQTAAANARATFTAAATAVSGGVLFYQWQKEGVNIPGAVRSTYITPPLASSDSGKSYRVVVSANGSSSNSLPATLTIAGSVTPASTPYIGINFGGGGNNAPGGTLSPQDVAGVVPQDHYNNIYAATFADVVLNDAAGAATPVTITVETGGTVGAGTGTSSADRELLQGYLHNNNAALAIRLNNLPAGTYDLIIYSVGFNFNTTYEQSLMLEGGAAYPVYSQRAQHAGQYVANPVFVEMDSTDPAARDLGNYTVFRNISPATDGSLLLTVTPENPGTPGITFLPAVNALQLVKPNATPASPEITVARTGATLKINWLATAAGFRLESSAAVGAGASWSAVAGTPNPITAAGSADVTLPASGNQFYRLVK